jgi:four helix bundle protein
VQDFKALKVCQKGRALTLLVYKSTHGFPPEERFGLTSQLRKAAFSIPANIAEGCGRGSGLDLKRFLHMSMGSASEVEYFPFLAKDLAVLPAQAFVTLEKNVIEVKRMLAGLIERVEIQSAKD